MADKRHSIALRQRKNTPLLYLLLIMFPLYGGYYHFSTFLAGFFLCLILLYESNRTGQVIIPCSLDSLFLGGYFLCSVITIPFAISTGMAVAGTLRIFSWYIFLVCEMRYTLEERDSILDATAYEGTILSLISIVSFFFNRSAGIEDANGRIDGLFQYANTWALFQLTCLTLIALRKTHNKWDYPALATLFLGVLLSGSRSVIIMTPLILIVCLFHRSSKFNAAIVISTLAVVLSLLFLANVLSNDILRQRLMTIGASSSSLNGRMLYAIDGVHMLLKHPLGLGYGGYHYQQCLEQTGIYTVRFVHNEYLQAALDTGVIGGLMFVLFVASFILKKGLPMRNRIVMILVAAHAVIDFDFQFSAMTFLALLCGGTEKTTNFTINKKYHMALLILLSFIFSFFTVAYYLDFAGKSSTAYLLWSSDLSITERCMQGVETVEQGIPYADNIIKRNAPSMLAWDCKFQAAEQSGDISEMVWAKYQYLRLNRYRGEVYEQMTELLKRAIVQSKGDDRAAYAAVAQAVIIQMEEVKDHTNPLAYRIVDRPELEFITRLLPQLNKITEEG